MGRGAMLGPPGDGIDRGGKLGIAPGGFGIDRGAMLGVLGIAGMERGGRLGVDARGAGAAGVFSPAPVRTPGGTAIEPD